MNTYRGLHAAHYDLIYAHKPYADEARFIHELLEEAGVPAGGRLLDLACGTGRHARELAVLGYEVTGVDYGPELLEVARRSAPDIRFELQDMRELSLGEERFDAVTCLFDSIGYPQTNDGVIAALTAARRHLAPAGRLVVEFLHAPALLRGAAPVKVARFDLPDGELLGIAETDLDVARQVMNVSYELLELRGERHVRGSERQSNRFFAVEEMRALMSVAGLRASRFLPAYRPGAGIDESAFHVIAVAEPGE